jgi:hypothetical protein
MQINNFFMYYYKFFKLVYEKITYKNTIFVSNNLSPLVCHDRLRGSWNSAICSFPVLFFPPCGAWLELGLECSRLICYCYRTILFSSSIRQVVLVPVTHFCSFFGYVVFGWCGTSGILEFSRQKNQLLTKC